MAPQIDTSTGARLKELRMRAGLTVRKAAEHVALSPGALSNFENGKRQISADILSKLTDFYGVSSDYLLGKTTHFDEEKMLRSPAMQLNESGSEWLGRINGMVVKLDDKNRQKAFAILEAAFHDVLNDD